MDSAKSKKIIIFKKEYLEKTLWTAFSALLSLAEARNGVFPFGIALLTGCDTNPFNILLGNVTAGVFGGKAGIVRILISMSIFGIKWLFFKRKKKLSITLKVMLSLAAGGALCGYEFAMHNVLFESAVRASVTFSLLPLFAFLFSLYTPKKNDSSALAREISILAWVFALPEALKVLHIGVFAPELIIGIAVTLYFAREGAFFGGMCGFAAGCACGIVYIPIFIIAGLSYGIFCDEKRIFALIFSCTLSLTSGVYLTSISGAFPEFINVIIGMTFFGIIRGKLPEVKRTVQYAKSTSKELKLIANAFSSISEAFPVENSGISKSESASYIKTLLFSECGKCSDCANCKIDRFDFSIHLNELANGCEKQIPSHFSADCRSCGKLVSDAIRYASNASVSSDKNMKLISDGYMSFSRLLNTAGENCENEKAINHSLSKKAEKLLSDLNINHNSVIVSGVRKPHLTAYISNASAIRHSSGTIKNEFSKCFGVKMSEPEFIKTASGWKLVMRTVPKYRVEYGKSAESKAGEQVSGDTSIAFETENMMFYSLISDGMGSGKDAAISSRLAALFIEKLIHAGGDKKEAVYMLNRMLISRKNEVFTTVDLLEVDLITGNGTLLKAGAAPTYLKRNNKFFVIESETPPAGVVEDLKISCTDLQFKNGDSIIMLSDGITVSEGSDLLINEKNPAKYASGILESHKNSASDDMSVCVINIKT